ncbi:MAG: SpoIID/LytB domain-containing protein [bacterium]
MKLNIKKEHIIILAIGICLAFLSVIFNFYIITVSDWNKINTREEKMEVEERKSDSLEENNKIDSNKEKKLEKINLVNKDVGELLEEAKNNYYQGNENEALQIYQYILEEEPDNLKAIKNLYYINKESGILDKAIQYLENILDMEKDSLYWNYRLAVAYYQQGSYIEAKDLFIKLEGKQDQIKNEINENPDENYDYLLTDKEYSISLYYLAQTYFHLAEFNKAEEIFLKGIEIEENLVLNYYGLANLYNSQGDYSKAIKFYHELIKRDSSLSSVFPLLAQSYEKIEDYRLAYSYWNRSIATNNQRNYARKRVNKILENHPEFRQEEIEEKKRLRKEIKWMEIADQPVEDNIPEIRIGLVEKVDSLSLQFGSDFKIYDSKNKLILEAENNTEYKIDYNQNNYKIFKDGDFQEQIENTEPIKIIANDNMPFMLYDVSYGENYFWAGSEDRQYRGILELYPVNNNSFNAINIINLEEYLFSVVPAEMPAWWPEEAIKAQTIAARTYAVSNLGKHESSGFDLCDTVHCAAYNGIKAETQKTNQLILETSGEIASYNNKAITAVFSSNSGGYSEKSVDIWGGNVEYLNGANNMIDDFYRFPLEPYQLEEWLLSEPDSFSNHSPYAGKNIYRWIMVLDANYFKERYNLENVIDIITKDRTDGGTVNTVILKSEDREIEFRKDEIRSSLGGLKSNRFIIEKSYSDDNYLDKIIIYGSGWGHHVGMDQTAAAGMASINYSYKDIVEHFYNGVNIENKY